MTHTIKRITAIPVSFALPEQHQVRLGIGRTVKRDAVIIRVESEQGAVGWGESHAARAPGAVAALINQTMAPMIIGGPVDARDELRDHIFRMQVNSHGMGTAAVIAYSGIDLALWDLWGHLQQRSVSHLLGAERHAIAAYAGGVTLGFGLPEAVCAEAETYVRQGHRAVKLRIGESTAADGERLRALRGHLGSDIRIMTDANTSLTPDRLRELLPVLEACEVAWLEEPFPPHAFAAYRQLQGIGSIPIAAGENHYGLHEFERMLDDGAVEIWQPDLSKTGGLTEALKIARLAAENDITIHPHTSLTALNMAASLHFLTAIDNAGYFEADKTPFNPLREIDPDVGFEVDGSGHLAAPSGNGFGVSISEGRLNDFPVIEGAGYV